MRYFIGKYEEKKEMRREIPICLKCRKPIYNYDRPKQKFCTRCWRNRRSEIISQRYYKPTGNPIGRPKKK